MGGLVGAGCVLHNMYICRFRCRYGWLGPTWRGRLSIALVQSSGAQETSCWTGWAATICQVQDGNYFQVFSALFSQEKSFKIFASCNSKDFWIALCLAQSAEVTILSCAAVSVEPLLKAHTDSLEALFASCKTLRLDSVKVRVAGKFSPCVLFCGPNLKILEWPASQCSQGVAWKRRRCWAFAKILSLCTHPNWPGHFWALQLQSRLFLQDKKAEQNQLKKKAAREVREVE